jgi:hypothetical protein
MEEFTFFFSLTHFMAASFPAFHLWFGQSMMNMPQTGQISLKLWMLVQTLMDVAPTA